MLFMRIGNIFWATLLATLAFACVPLKSHALGSGDGVAIQYYFEGAANLTWDKNFLETKEFFSTAPAGHFKDFVLDRLAHVYWKGLQFDPAGNPTNLLQPMLDDLLQVESAGSFGGRDANQMDFVIAAKLDAQQAALWQKNLEAALRGKGEPLTEDGFSGQRWNRPGNDSFWILRARDWTVVGRGEDLVPVRHDYLLNIKQDNRPASVMKESWLSASVDWPLLATWAPLSHCPLKLARTIVDVTASGGRMRATAYVSYPDAIPWESEPLRIPRGLVSGPLTSFTMARNLAPYLNSNPALSRLSSNPLASQLYCWALRPMALQSYAAWPVADATNLMLKLKTEAPSVLNPMLEARNHSQLNWLPQKDQLLWDHLPLTGPILGAAHDQSGDFLLAKVFPMDPEFVPASDQLWSQFDGRDDLVYYDWEITGRRLFQWRLLSEIVPVFPSSSLQEAPRPQKAQAPQNAKQRNAAKPLPISLIVTEAWLASLALPDANTVTEVTRTSPTELTVVRNSQFLFTGLEWVLLSHWLADAPVGPVDLSLIPRPKMSGPGLAPSH
jgi:hypothetical protein